MKGTLLFRKNDVILICFILIFVFLSACSGVTPANPAVNSFTADTYILEEGESAILSWTTTDADTVTLNPGSLTVALSGSTPVSPTTTTTYTLTATNSAGSGSASITIVVNPAVIVEQTITIPLEQSSGKDSVVYKENPDTNFSNTELVMGNGYMPISILRSFLQFDLSTVPANATIISAELKLFKYDSVNTEDFSIGVHKLMGEWLENTLTWNNQPSYDSTPEDTTSSTSGMNIWLSWDITSLMQGWINGNIDNYGVVLKDTNEVSIVNYISCYNSEYMSEITLRPKLEITYYIP